MAEILGESFLGFLALAAAGALILGFLFGPRIQPGPAALRGLVLLVLAAASLVWIWDQVPLVSSTPVSRATTAPRSQPEVTVSIPAEPDPSGLAPAAGPTEPPAPLPTSTRSTESAAGPAAVEPEIDESGIWRLVIPALKVDVSVTGVPLVDRKWDVSKLQGSVGWLGGTSRPGTGGNTVLAGHVTTRTHRRGPFYRLQKLKPGAEVRVYTEKNVYTFRVEERLLVDAKDTYVTAATENPQLTLLTCADWDHQQSTYEKRLVVFASLIRVTPVREADLQ